MALSVKILADAQSVCEQMDHPLTKYLVCNLKSIIFTINLHHVTKWYSAPENVPNTISWTVEITILVS